MEEVAELAKGEVMGKDEEQQTPEEGDNNTVEAFLTQACRPVDLRLPRACSLLIRPRPEVEKYRLRI